MKVAFYGRYSSNNQTEQSIEGQLHVCERYAEQQGLEIVRQYIDRAKSGTSDARPEFQRMIADSDSGVFQGVLVYKLDRFARNRYDSAIYKRKLRKAGVRVISATENITDTPEGIMLEGMLESMNEFYSAELSQKVNRGLAESFQKGHYLKRIPPFGYQIIGKKLVPDDETAPIAAEIFQRYADGARIVDIVNWLNGLGMTNQKGNAWRPMNVSTHLHNRTYMGEYYYGQFEEPMPCPALVAPELFQKVQERLEKYANRRRQRTDFDFILTGKLVCAHCGHSVSGSTANEKNHYYYCRHCAKEHRHCIPAEYLHDRVRDALATYLSLEKVDELADAMYFEYRKEQIQDIRPALERELKDVEKQLQNAVQAILRGVDLDTLTDSIEQLKARRETLRRSIDEAPTPMPKLKRDYFVAMLRHLISHNESDLLNIVVNRIILNDEQVVICINLTDEAQLPPLEQILFSISQPDSNSILNNIKLNQQWIFIAA